MCNQILPQIEFKAGKCTLSPQTDGSFLVTPDVKKGLISILRGNDGVTHFRWIDRASSAVVDDYVVTRDDVVFKAVNTGRSADRVFILKWKNSNNRHMFWMQHKNGSDDPAIVTKVNDCINTPPPQQAAADWMNMLRCVFYTQLISRCNTFNLEVVAQRKLKRLQHAPNR